MLKSCPVWSPWWKHSAHSDMQGEMPHVRQRPRQRPLCVQHPLQQRLQLLGARTVVRPAEGGLQMRGRGRLV
ncbi:hypothetical protein NN561_020336 [Cricetulus griseus]